MAGCRSSACAPAPSPAPLPAPLPPNPALPPQGSHRDELSELVDDRTTDFNVLGARTHTDADLQEAREQGEILDLILSPGVRSQLASPRGARGLRAGRPVGDLTVSDHDSLAAAWFGLPGRGHLPPEHHPRLASQPLQPAPRRPDDPVLAALRRVHRPAAACHDASRRGGPCRPERELRIVSRPACRLDALPLSVSALCPSCFLPPTTRSLTGLPQPWSRRCCAGLPLVAQVPARLGLSRRPRGARLE